MNLNLVNGKQKKKKRGYIRLVIVVLPIWVIVGRFEIYSPFDKRSRVQAPENEKKKKHVENIVSRNELNNAKIEN